MDNKVELVLYAVIAFVVLNILAIAFVITQHFESAEKQTFSLGEIIKISAEDAAFKKVVNRAVPINAKGRDDVNTLYINPDYTPTTFIIHEPEEFDYKSRNDIFATRMRIMKSYQAKDKENYKNDTRIFRDNYKPSNIVFGGVEGGRPWWGLKGLVCKGAGMQARAGLSEESRFINNPMLLISIDTTLAWTIKQWDCPEIYPKPTSLHLIPDKKKFIAIFQISDFHEQLFSQIRWGNLNKEDFQHFYMLNALNARDFGYEYGYLIDSKNIEFKSPENIGTMIHKFKNYIHVAGSCRVDSRGCNNGSPFQDELVFKIVDYPAEMTLHLFKERPKEKHSNPDVVYQIKIN